MSERGLRDELPGEVRASRRTEAMAMQPDSERTRRSCHHLSRHQENKQGIYVEITESGASLLTETR